LAHETTWTLRSKQAPDFITKAWAGSNRIVAMVVSGKPSLQRHPFLTSLQTTAKALLQLVRDRWCIQTWHLLPGT
jgi:hypothetical protein